MNLCFPTLKFLSISNIGLDIGGSLHRQAQMGHPQLLDKIVGRSAIDQHHNLFKVNPPNDLEGRGN